MTEQFVVEVDGHGSLLNSKHLHGILYSIEWRWIPKQVHTEIGSDIMGYTHIVI